MSEWLSESEITSRLGYKILLAGLSEAGKTAVKRIFFLKQQTEDVSDLAATLNYERLILNIAGIPITIVDLGGQRVFLKRFLGSFSPFIFSNVKAFIFLIDVANKTTRNNSIQYFTGCIEKLKEFSLNAEYYVFFHKNDLVRHLPNYESIHEQLKEQFQLETAKRISFFRTTIYRPETVIDSFGRIFELTMPELVESDYVDGRRIGEIEEFGEKFVTVAPTAAQKLEREITPHVLPPMGQMFPSLEKPLPPADSAALLESLQRLMPPSEGAGQPLSPEPKSPAKAAGDPAVLAKLQNLMQAGLVREAEASEPIAHSVPYLSSMAAEETVSETTLAAKDSAISTEPESPSEIPQLEENELLNERISHLIRFYGIDMDDAIAVAKSAHTDVFESAASLRIPIPLILDFILKYIPFIASKGLKVESLTSERILDILGSFLRGKVRENELLQCLVIAAEKPTWEIEKIVGKFFLKPKEKPKEKTEQVQISVSIEADSPEGVLTLPDCQGIGFTVELTADSNCQLFFYQGGYNISKALVSGKVTVDELMYLLFYELHLPFESGKNSINFAARIIHGTIAKAMKPSEIELPTPSAVVETEKPEFIIPMEIETEEDFLIIPDSPGVAFKVETAEKGFQIMFKQRGHDIGQMTIPKPMSVRQLVSLIRDVMLLPIESDEAIDFAARIIIAAFQMLQHKGISTSAAIEKHVPAEEDETSEELRRYLMALRELDD
ncbi:MAG: ADP-ribosylation factor-like protein [Candidatus Hodarchaeales archaeon]|jgi:GTPase SAR1 family protein